MVRLPVVELTPARPNGRTIVLVHGAMHTTACYLTTPDDRPGWAYAFKKAGYRTILPDWGRVCPVETPDGWPTAGDLVCRALGDLLQRIGEPVDLLVHSMAGPFGFRLLETHGELIRTLVAIAPGPPGNIQSIPDLLFSDAERVSVGGSRRVDAVRHGWLIPTDEFIDRIIGDAGRFPIGRRSDYRASLAPVRSEFYVERLNIEGSQLRIEDVAALAGRPVLVMTGTRDRGHSREVDGRVARWLAGIGACAEFDYLGDRGIVGNGHMMMLEDNSDELAELILLWLSGIDPASPLELKLLS